MGLSDDERKALVIYRLEKANKLLRICNPKLLIIRIFNPYLPVASDLQSEAAYYKDFQSVPIPLVASDLQSEAAYYKDFQSVHIPLK